jgi:hypothetical protein
MRGLPALVILALIVLSGLLIAIGWWKHNDAGYLPFILGILWGLFALGAIIGRLRPTAR